MFPFLLQGLALGFAAGAQPGPFQTFLISQTLSQGWRRTWIAAFGPLVSDGPIVALMNALSPGPYLFWSLVIGPLIVSAWRESSAGALSIVLGFYVAMVGLNMTVVLLFGQAARFGNQVRKAMLGLSVLALAGFGLYQLWQGVFT